MSADKPDHHDADLILKLYDLRREPVMRQSREAVARKFFPKAWEDLAAVLKPDHPLNTAYRQVSSYWEMAAGFVTYGILNDDLFAESCGEGLFLFAKVSPHLERLRKEHSPFAYQNIEWVVRNNQEARRRLELAQARLKSMMAAP